MKNVELEIVENHLIITVDLSQDCGPSKSGKTRVIGTTAGNVSVPGAEGVKIGLTVYKYLEDGE